MNALAYRQGNIGCQLLIIGVELTVFIGIYINFNVA
jgi:hypothetical protein